MTRTFLIQDIDCRAEVQVVSRKEALSYVDEYLENFPYEWFDRSWASTCILYKDGSYDYIDEDYDGHKIKRQNIASIVFNNECDSIVYGKFEINEYGVVTTSFEEIIADTNIVEIK